MRNKLSRQQYNDREDERFLREFTEGKISKQRFMAHYAVLRARVNARIHTLLESGLDSNSLQDALWYNYLSNGGSDYFGAFRKQADPVTTYIKMMEFQKSVWTTKKGFKEASAIYQDFQKAVERNKITSIPTESEFIRFVANGDFARLVKILGNSPEAVREAEAAFYEGATAEDFVREIEEFERSQMSLDWNDNYATEDIFDNVRIRAQIRKENYEKARRREMEWG